MENKLELKHLAPYLPYKLEMWDANNEVKWMVQPCHFANRWEFSFSSKPILRPLSDLTKEIKSNGQKFIPINKLGDKFSSVRCELYPHTVNYHTEDLESINLLDKYFAFTNLFEWHFDVFGLIDKGLAIDINTLPSLQDKQELTN